MRLAIVGAGSSGLVTLKQALDALPEWEIVCFEKSNSLRGAWGDMPPDFVSTSTKYTTQFACFRRFDAAVDGHEFYRGSEFGDYLESFAEAFGLKQHIRFNTPATTITREAEAGRWRVNGDELFDALIVCTGLADRPPDLPDLQGKTVVVTGGGESAVDLAQRLCRTNRVYLSLRSGIRVSPRYHPIRGVPSDFLRTRLMESIHEDLRNTLGLAFVRARMRYEELFRRFTGAGRDPHASSHRERRKFWSLLLTERAKDQLFKMFHNKSDDFLDSVAEGRITIVGEPAEGGYRDFLDESRVVPVEPDQVFACTGYTNSLGHLGLKLRDFHLGCVHAHHDNLFLVGFARPIIGNIPSLAEMQARYVTGLLAKRFPRPEIDVEAEFGQLQQRYPRLDIDNVYPVEWIPYCDELARRMGCYPLPRSWKLMLVPACTHHYFEPELADRQEIHLPPVAIALLLAVKLFDLVYRAVPSK